MKKLLGTLFVLTTALSGFTDSQVVYYPAATPMNTEIKTFLNDHIKTSCPSAFANGDVYVSDTKVEYDEIDQGQVDTYYTVTVIAENFMGNDDYSDEITVVIEDADLSNSPRLAVISTDATGDVCK